MAKEIKTQIIINASSARVWSVLTDFNSFPEWNPFIKSLRGNVAVGGSIEVVVQPSGGKAMAFKPKVLSFEVNRELSWLGKVMFSGLFDGLHKFTLSDNDDGTTILHHEERFSGILVPFINLDTTEDGFQAMNEKVKELAEKS